MAADKDELLALERKFWSGDAEFYERNVDARCMIAFTQMAGVRTNTEIAGTVGSGSRWSNLDLEPKGFMEPASDVAFIVYEASATRENGEAYSALVSSGYARRDGGWKMIFHQHTPLDAAKAG